METSRCGCGCGGWGDECRDENLQDEWEARTGYHYRRATIERYREDHKEELKDPGSYVYLVDIRVDDNC